MKLITINLRLFAITLLVFGLGYPILIFSLSKLFPNGGEGDVKIENGQIVAYHLVGQAFTKAENFWGRPSAVAYNAAATGGSNQGPTNPSHLQAVNDRMDTILKYHPYLTKKQIPSDWVTASGSGIDPHLSLQATLLQVKRVAKARNLDQHLLENLVLQFYSTNKPAIVGPYNHVNISALNQFINQNIQN